MKSSRLFHAIVLLAAVVPTVTAQPTNPRSTRDNSAAIRNSHEQHPPKRRPAVRNSDVRTTPPMAHTPIHTQSRQAQVMPVGFAEDAPADENRARAIAPASKNSKPLPLKRRGDVPAGADSVGTRSKPVSVLLTAASSLSIVLGLFAVVVWIARRRAGNPLPLLPQDVIDVLGRTRIAERQTLQLIRLGHRLLLVSVTPSGAETLAEVTEREEVDRLVGLCNQYRPGSSSATFRDVLSELGTRSGSRLVRDLAVAQPKATSITTAR